MPSIPDHNAYIIVDVEAAGPAPPTYALLSIGACTLAQPRSTFYIELQPDTLDVRAESLQVSGLSISELAANGTPPKAAMQAFADWAMQAVPKDAQPIFTAFNAPFDWMYTAYYFERYLGRNPFGHKALDIKALAMGHAALPWLATAHIELAERYGLPTELPHNALEDALIGADLLDALLLDIFMDQERSHEPGPHPQS
jgi:DNA polymerase III epsilon subunit-like protein